MRPMTFLDCFLIKPRTTSSAPTMR
jgi:hypothetical protein